MSNVIYLSPIGITQLDLTRSDPACLSAVHNERIATEQLLAKVKELNDCLELVDRAIEVVEDATLRKSLKQRAREDRAALNEALCLLQRNVFKLQGVSQ